MIAAGEVVLFALRGLAANRLRSMMTTLGIMVGVAAVILLTAVVGGARAMVEQSMAGLGADILTVSPLRQAGPGGAAAGRALTTGDAQALVDPRGAPDITAASPVVSSSATTATYQGSSYRIGQFLGSDAGYFAATNTPVARGRAFTTNDVTAAGKVVVLGSGVADQLFGTSAAAIGKPLLVNNVPFVVVGVLAAKGASGLQDVDDTAIAPLTTVENVLTGHKDLNWIVVRAVSADAATAARAQAVAILGARHRISQEQPPDFRVLGQQQQRAARTMTVGTFTVLLAAVAAISLVAGGIGITNIMLVTAPERIREIGVRDAVGAPRGVVFGQFFTEAALLSLGGGVLGVAVGVVGTRFTIAGIHPFLAPSSVLLAFVVSALVGLVFGSYPAIRATWPRPVAGREVGGNSAAAADLTDWRL